MERSVFRQGFQEGAVYFLCIIQIRIARFLRERIGVQPVCQQQIHAQPPLRKLGRMNMKIGKSRYDHVISEVFHRSSFEFLRQSFVDSFHPAVFHGDIAVGMSGQFIPVF